MPLTTLVVQSSPGTSALNGTAPDPTNVPGLNWFATTASFARLAGGGITNGGAGLSTLSYLLPTSLHKVSTGTTSSLANGNQYVMLLCNGSANNANLFSGSGYYLYIRGGGLSTASIIRVVSAVQTHTINFTGSPLTNGVITAASLDCSVSGTVSASITFGGNTYTQSYTDPSPLTGSYAGSVFGDQGGGTVTMASLTLEGDLGITYTYARPSSDVTTQWTPSTAGPHYALIDEVTYNDADYIYATAAAQTDEVGLQAMSIPTAGTDVLVNYRVQGITGSGSVTVSLYSGATLVKTDTTRTANNTSPAYYTMTVTAAEWGAVAVNWSDMRLRFVSA